MNSKKCDTKIQPLFTLWGLVVYLFRLPLGQILSRYLGVAFLVWLGITGTYGAGSTPVEASFAYNSPEMEFQMVIFVIPLLALAWPLWILAFLLLSGEVCVHKRASLSPM